MAILERKYIINAANVNSNAIITNLGMLSMFEDVAGKHSDIAGYGIMDIPKTNLFWVLLAWKVNFYKRVKYGDEVTLRTWAKNAGQVFTYRDFEVIDQNGETICIATSKWALIHTKNRHLSKITDDIICKYEPENKNIFENLEIEKLKEPKTFSHKFIYKTQRRDIDINKHMHNSNYLSLAYEALPEDVYNSGEYNNFEITYKTSIEPNDTVKCLYSYVDDAHYVTIKSIDEKKLHAIVKLYNTF